jgi:hypothetical protein
MKAELLLDRRDLLSETAFVERIVWLLPKASPGSAHRFNYRLALVVTESASCVTTTKLAKAITGTFSAVSRDIDSPGSTNCSPTFAPTSNE